MTLADCFFTMLLILSPIGGDSRFEDHRLRGAACMSNDLSFMITEQYELLIRSKWWNYTIPLPQRKDRVRLSYKMQDQFAYLGDCEEGFHPYSNPWSSCQRVMVRLGPNGYY